MNGEENIPLVFSSELALKRSIRKKYPLRNFSQERKQEIWDATFEDNKKYIGMSKDDMENYMDNIYKKHMEKDTDNI